VFLIRNLVSCFVFFVLSSSLIVGKASASACCARSAATPFLIVGDDQAQLNFGISAGGVVARTGEDGVPVFGSPQYSDRTQLFRLDAATLLSDRLQMGISFPWVSRTVNVGSLVGSTGGIGDIRLSLGYEVLPAWTYSKWKPQGYLFSVLSFPTGISKFEYQNPTASDVTGNGFYSASMGSLLLRRWVEWDLFFVPEVHYSLPRTFSRQNHAFEVVPGWGGSVGAGAGFSPGGGEFRFGVRVQPRLDQANRVPAFDRSASSISWIGSCDTGIDFSYLLGSRTTLMLSYTDQTLLDPAINSNLSRTLGFNLQHRWER
jgi:hypothetical protein